MIYIEDICIDIYRRFTGDIFWRRKIYVAINSPLLLSLPHSITCPHCCQSWLDIAARIDSCGSIGKKSFKKNLAQYWVKIYLDLNDPINSTLSMIYSALKSICSQSQDSKATKIHSFLKQCFIHSALMSGLAKYSET